jgi:nitrogen-specific signal transduction histidine kinase
VSEEKEQDSDFEVNIDIDDNLSKPAVRTRKDGPGLGFF